MSTGRTRPPAVTDGVSPARDAQKTAAAPGAAGRRSRKDRGNRTQLVVSEWYCQLWPHATPQGSGRPGRDVVGVPLSIEVKARAGFNPLAWVREARKRERPAEDTLPAHVVMRPNGLGEQSLADWLVIRRLGDDTAILAELISLRNQLSLIRGEQT